MKYDFTHVGTQQLAWETKRRAEDLGEVTGKMWGRVPVAWLGCSIGLVIGTVPLALHYPFWLECAGVVVGLIVGAPCFLWFYKAARECNQFTKEMRARNRELRLRIGGIRL